MFDFGIGSTELMVILVVAIIVVGPKDLPRLLRTIAGVVNKVRGLAREFQGHLDEAIRDTGLDDIKDNVSRMKEFSVADLDKEFEDLEKEFRETAMPDKDKPGNETLFADDAAAAEETSGGDKGGKAASSSSGGGKGKKAKAKKTGSASGKSKKNKKTKGDA